MAINMEVKHLRVLKLLNFTKGKHLEFLEFFLDTKKANINSYIKDLYDQIPYKKSITKLDEIIDEIINTNHSRFLKYIGNISLSKKDRVFFLTLRLLLKTTLNLQTLSNILEVSRRTLNDDILQLKKDLSIYNLEILSLPGKGIFLEGTLLDRKRALCTYIYKYLIEEKDLPKVFIDFFHEIFHSYELDDVLQEQIEIFINLGHCDAYFYNRELLKSFYISFKYLDDDTSSNEQIKNNLNQKEKFILYFGDFFKESSLDDIYEFFQESLFGEISIEYIFNLINILKISKGVFPEESIYLPEHYKFFQKVFNKILNTTIDEDEFLNNFISRVIFCQKQDHYLPIYEMSFLNLYLDDIAIEKSIEIFKALRKKYWNISFTDTVSLYLYVNSKRNKEEEKKLTIVYNNIPKPLLEQLKNKIELHNNIIIKDFININLLSTFIQEYPIKTIGIFEPFLEEHLKNFKVKNLIIPA